MDSDLVGGRYRLEEQLSATQMAEVWLAHDPQLERRVVVKLLAADADRQRFEREARAAAALAHPNIVQLFDYGEDRGRPYMVLEYVPGGTLSDRLPPAERLSDHEARAISTDVASGLAHAHRNGVVHRDLKPGNVLFDAEGHAKIADFGIAHVQGVDTLTEDGTVLGTAAYMSPEQVRGEPATAASDVYSFGILLYRMLAGRLPFEAENPLELAAMQRDLEPAPLHSIRPDAPADLAALATAALAKPPSARPADGSELLAALKSEPPTMPLAGAADAPTRLIAAPVSRRRTWPRYAIAAAALAAIGLALAIVLFRPHSSSPTVGTTKPATGTHPATTHASTTAPATQSTSASTTSPTTSTAETRTGSQPTTTAPSPPPSTSTPTTAPTTAATTTTTTPSTSATSTGP